MLCEAFVQEVGHTQAVRHTTDRGGNRHQWPSVCGGRPASLATADWLEELALFGTARNVRDQEVAYQLAVAIENLYLARLVLRK